ncbi:MAG: hypothetical protein K0S23_1916 [Fluviicola sp.]|jgi:hypothetical protein|uniref:hypothetical protein n=1 Tax=Fluviicola sp. TaxID=1917219 RepID=UPI002609BFF5|nr:hypothetical protein [Fluviicola sp.]MDF3027609.1 hypothetical protein [Fluviicola sp.]
MKAKSIRYSIPTPCHESWNDMKPENKGRFCGSCEKSVVDFTSMPDFSIVNYLENHKNEKVCGRFTKPQLDRVYRLNQPVFSSSFDLRTVVLGLALTTFSAVHSYGQTEPAVKPLVIDTLRAPAPVVGTVQQVEPMIIEPVDFMEPMLIELAMTYDHRSEKKATGIIITRNKKFKGIVIQLKDDSGKILKTYYPDSKGRFVVKLNWKLKPAYLDFWGEGNEQETIKIRYKQSIQDMKIELGEEQGEMIRGEVIQGDVKATEDAFDDLILQKISIGNVSIETEEK